jgi:hypothetical protein
LGREDLILASQLQEIAMEFDDVQVLLSFAMVQFALQEREFVVGRRQRPERPGLFQARELRQELFASGGNEIGQISFMVREVQKGTGGAEFLALKEQRSAGR